MHKKLYHLLITMGHKTKNDLILLLLDYRHFYLNHIPVQGNKMDKTDLHNIDFDAAKWNQLLTIVGKGERTQAIAELDKIIAGEKLESYKSKAESIKTKLNSFWYGWAN